MRHESEFWFDSCAGAVAVLAIPFYIGLAPHLGVGHLVLYSGAAGIGMATGEQIQYGAPETDRIGDFARTAAMWAAAVLVLGSLAYLIALLI